MIGKAQKIVLGLIIAIIVVVEGTTIGFYLKANHENKILKADVEDLTATNEELFKENTNLSDLLKQASAEQSKAEAESKEIKGEPKLILSDKLGSMKYDIGSNIKGAKTGIVIDDKSLKANPVFEMDNEKYGTKITSLGVDDVLTISDADGVMHQYKITKGSKLSKKPTAKDNEMVLFTKQSDNNYYVIYAKKTF